MIKTKIVFVICTVVSSLSCRSMQGETPVKREDLQQFISSVLESMTKGDRESLAAATTPNVYSQLTLNGGEQASLDRIREVGRYLHASEIDYQMHGDKRRATVTFKKGLFPTRWIVQRVGESWLLVEIQVEG